MYESIEGGSGETGPLFPCSCGGHRVNTDELPEGWELATLAELVSPSSEKVEPEDRPNSPYLSLEHIEPHTNRIIGQGTGADVGSTKAVFRAGDVLYGKLRPYLNKVAIPDFDGICSTDILVFQRVAHLDAKFLMRLLSRREVVDFANHNSAGVQLPRISFKELGTLEVPLPPLAEQRRIVAAVERILDKVTAARARLDRVPTTLKRFRQAVLAAASSGRLTEDWREVTPAQSSATARGEAGPEELPEAWMWVRFGNQLRSIRSGSTTPPKTDPTAFPILRSSSVRPGSIDLSDVKYLSSDESNNPDNYLADGDLLFTRLSGSLEYVANCARVRISATTRIQYPDRLFCAKLLDPAKADYFVYAFASPVVREMLTDGAKSSAGHQRVSIGNITSQLIPLPPLAEQQEIVKRVSALFARADAIEAVVTAARKRVDTLTQAVLAKAFRGELVPTEAELARRENRPYEPAADLLARLQSTATAIAKPTRTRKTKPPPTS